MGITIHHRTEPRQTRLSEQQVRETIELTKGMAQEAGYDFIEIEERGLIYEEVTRTLEGGEDVKKAFVGYDWQHGMYPQIRMSAIRSGNAVEGVRKGVGVHCPNTETFSMMFLQVSDYPEFVMSPYEFCKTQPFSGEDASINAMSHIWIISVLVTIKENIIPEMYIRDEGDFYLNITDEDREYWREMLREGRTTVDYEAKYDAMENFDIINLMNAFGENLQMIEAIGQQLKKEFGKNVVTGMDIKTHTVSDENIVSAGRAQPQEQGNEYVYAMFSKAKKILEIISETPRKVSIPILMDEGQGLCPQTGVTEDCDIVGPCDDCPTPHLVKKAPCDECGEVHEPENEKMSPKEEGEPLSLIDLARDFE